MSDPHKTALVAMSGGVDSSVAAATLKQAGYGVTGVFLHLASGGEQAEPVRRARRHADDARRVAAALGVELVELDLREAFAGIMEYFAAEYARGRTPNPCVWCNATMKFARLIELADRRGAAHVATGHYARIGPFDGQPAILRAAARQKDQSYALCQLPRAMLSRVLLPVGELGAKARVRQLACSLHLPVHDKPDSQEICFAPPEGHVPVLRRLAPRALKPGMIVDGSGKPLGRHEGYGRFTVGQRRGLRVAAGVPMYVTGIDPASATVTIGPRQEVLRSGLTAVGANWQADVPPAFDATVQIRYNHAGAPGHVRLTGPGAFQVDFTEPVAAVTPGQAAVVYADDRLLGGGWIES